MTDCVWNSPGADPYRGTVAAAVARYEIPAPHDAVLVEKVRRLRSDGLLKIGKATPIRDMHFGNSACAGPVDRSKWADDHVEPALVYCSGDYCIAIPSVCGNIVRVDKPQGRAPLERDRGHGFNPEAPRPISVPGTFALAAIGLLALLRRRVS